MSQLSVSSVNQLRQQARSVVRELGLLNDAYFEIGVTLAERHLLIELAATPRPTMGEMADRLLIDKSTISRLIAKAMKKNYITSISDDKDKRKRYLELTEKGKETLQAFEPIAFRQTKEALLTLTDQEIETVYQGVALYAKGLKNSRLRLEQNHLPKIETFATIYEKLQTSGYHLTPFEQKDEESLYGIFKAVVDSGSQFPYECNSPEEFQRQFFSPGSKVYVCRKKEGEVIGGFYLKANYSGRSNHISNGAYMIKETHRGQGIGSLLIQASLHLAKSLKFQAMQFNMVLSENVLAVKLYEKLGFSIIGKLPQSVRKPDGSYQDGYIMHRSLKNL